MTKPCKLYSINHEIHYNQADSNEFAFRLINICYFMPDRDGTTPINNYTITPKCQSDWNNTEQE